MGIATPSATRAARRNDAALGERHRDLAHRLVLESVRREADRLPHGDGSAAGDEERRPGAMPPALVQEPVEDVDLGRRLIERARGVGRDHALALDHRRAVGREQLRGDDALQVLIEALEESEPAAVGLETQALELLLQRGEALGEAAFDFGLEQLEPLFGIDRRHFWQHYAGDSEEGKARPAAAHANHCKRRTLHRCR
jgi:hypothetical protein